MRIKQGNPIVPTIMDNDHGVRIDKFLYAVRLYKTRSLASDACRLGRILINDNTIKPSRDVVTGQIITVKKAPVTYTYKISGLTENRVAAKLVANYIEDLTPDSEKDKLTNMKETGVTIQRRRGLGRPTKKERRDIDRLSDGIVGW